MWELDWAAPPPANPRPASAFRTSLERADVAAAHAILWQEHCLECAIPQCYTTCPLYVARADHKCARLYYGIYPNRAFSGLHDFGADVRFRQWGKLEAKLGTGAATPDRLRQWTAADAIGIGLVNPVAQALAPLNPKRRLNGAYRVARDAFLEHTAHAGVRAEYDEFVIEAYNPDAEPVTLILELRQDRLRYRGSFRMAPGPNLHRIPFRAMDAELDGRDGLVLVYPENDAEARLIFTWLDFVRYTPAAARKPVNGTAPAAGNGAKTAATATPAAAAPPVDAPDASETPVPAAKIKCVAWDLDNTLWKGILIEDGPEGLVPNPEALELIRQLDERGIICTVVSKNDHDPAWAHIVALGLQDHLLFAAINWGRKSESLRRIADDMNIDLNTFAFIDDSPFERNEVAETLPQVRVYAETEIPHLLERPEFDVPVSAESRKRRLSYLVEGQRRQVAASYGDQYDEFLRSCELDCELYAPLEPAARKRVLELIQRSNQLNLSTHRYTEPELDALLANPDALSFALKCKDRFGDYGTVGFISVSLGDDPPVLRDFVMSCRVARKKVENGMFHWLAEALHARGDARLMARYVPSPRNGVLLEPLQEVGFRPAGEEPGARMFELPLGTPVADGTIVTVRSGLAVPPRRAAGTAPVNTAS